MKEIYEESEKKQGQQEEETTVVLNGFTLPKPEYTDLSLSWNDIEESKELHGVELYAGVNVFRPLEKQYEQLEEILLQKLSKATVDKIMNLVKQKKERFDYPGDTRFTAENRLIRVEFTHTSADVVVYEEK
jgi:hypothetical protein